MSSGGTELEDIVRIDQAVQGKLSVDVLLHPIGKMIFVKRLQVLNEFYSHAIRLQDLSLSFSSRTCGAGAPVLYAIQ